MPYVCNRVLFLYGPQKNVRSHILLYCLLLCYKTGSRDKIRGGVKSQLEVDELTLLGVGEKDVIGCWGAMLFYFDSPIQRETPPSTNPSNQILKPLSTMVIFIGYIIMKYEVFMHFSINNPIGVN